MLAHRLQRVQAEIQSHRCWLSAFVQQTRRYHRIDSPTLHPLVHTKGLWRNSTPRDGVRNAVPGTTAFATKQAKAKKAVLHLRLDVQSQRQIEALDTALNDATYKHVIQAYRGVGDKTKLSLRHTSKVTNALHQALRASKWAQGPNAHNDTGAEVMEFAEELVDDITNGQIVPNRRAHVRLLGMFKESGRRDAGVTFWKWLEAQDERLVDSDVYGAAIELLAVHGTPLPELEELYQQALARFPGTFASYHLSPEAILPDRDHQTTLAGMPMTLLQGILTARLLNGDIRNAYLALDTALRLYPDQLPARFFTLFSEERPVVEAYTVFAMAWRAGISIPLGHVKYQMSALRSHADGISAKRHPMALRAMLSVLYMHLSAKGTMTQNSMNELVIAMTQLLRMDAITSMEAKDKQRIVRAVMDLIRKGIAVFARFGAWPGLSAFNSIIVNLGGYGHSKQTIGVALADAQALGIEPNEVTRRSIIIAAGLLDDAELVKKGWEQVVEARTTDGEVPDVVDFHCLIKAAHLTGQIDFAREAFEKYAEHFEENEREILSSGLDDGNMYNLGVVNSPEEFSVSMLLKQIEKISKDLDVIDERTKDPRKLQDYSEQALPMRFLVEDEVLLPEEDLRGIYNDMTTEPQSTKPAHSGGEDSAAEPPEDSSSAEQPSGSQDYTASVVSSEPTEQSPSPPPPPALTPTNIPFSTIRYENWKLINWLLETSEANDKAYQEAVDKAIAAGTAPPARSKGLGPTLAWRDVEGVGLSDLMDGDKRKDVRRAKGEDVRMAKDHILRLRGRAM